MEPIFCGPETLTVPSDGASKAGHVTIKQVTQMAMISYLRASKYSNQNVLNRSQVSKQPRKVETIFPIMSIWLFLDAEVQLRLLSVVQFG